MWCSRLLGGTQVTAAAIPRQWAPQMRPRAIFLGRLMASSCIQMPQHFVLMRVTIGALTSASLISTVLQHSGLIHLMTAQYTVQIKCSTDQCKMGEGLRKIAQRLTLRTRLLCIEPEMIRVT